MFDVKTYSPAGETLRRFHQSGKFFRLGAGPVGSGKTAAFGCVEMVLGAMIQNPFPDGVRRAKFGVLRDSYRNLYSQFIPSWHEWFPREMGHFVGSDDRPAMHKFSLDTPVGPCEIQVEMRALGTNSVEATCRGWNLTGCFLDEVDLMPENALSFLAGRVKRWPQKPYRVSKGVWASFNKPDVDHWLYRMCVEEKPEDLEFFDQPGGLLPGGPPWITNPEAENLERLDDDYYQKQAAMNPDWYVRRMILNQWGSSVSGEVIYPEFRADLHVAGAEMEPLPGSQLVLAFDAGGTPAAVVLGRDPEGGRFVFAEVVLVDPYDPRGKRLLHGVGPKRFAEAVKDALWPRFNGCSVTLAYGDPAAQYGADREMGEYSWLEIVGHELGIPVLAAPSNEIDLRLEAVRSQLRSLDRNGRPRLRFNPSCKWLRRGFVADYKWEEADPKQPGKRLKPQKSVTSHVHDALQYGVLGDVGRAGVTGGAAFDRWQPKKALGEAGHTVWGEMDRRKAEQQGAGGPAYKSDFSLWR